MTRKVSLKKPPERSFQPIGSTYKFFNQLYSFKTTIFEYNIFLKFTLKNSLLTPTSRVANQIFVTLGMKI